MDAAAKNSLFAVCLLLILTLMLLHPLGVWANNTGSLYLSTAPPAQERSKGYKLESEHRAIPLRKYWLNLQDLPGEVTTLVLHPDGSTSKVPMEKGADGLCLSFALPMKDGPMHGIHNTYVVERLVKGDELLVRVAKWITIHHSCGWGHDYRYDPQRITPTSLRSIPLEIVCDGLWNGNFHSEVRSGDRIEARILRNGALVSGAKVRLTTARGWSKEVVSNERGIASFQLIRDYYPEKWSDFVSSHRERFTIEAELEAEEKGTFSDRSYERVRLLSTLAWGYAPSRDDYSSYKYGLSLGAFTLFATGIGVYTYRERRKRPYREVPFDEKD